MKRVWSITVALIKGVVKYLFTDSPPSYDFRITPLCYAYCSTVENSKNTVSLWMTFCSYNMHAYNTYLVICTLLACNIALLPECWKLPVDKELQGYFLSMLLESKKQSEGCIYWYTNIWVPSLFITFNQIQVYIQCYTHTNGYIQSLIHSKQESSALYFHPYGCKHKPHYCS